jgi:hypothetical protein
LRDILEDSNSEALVIGIAIGVYNSRGVVSRSIGEGGLRERGIATRYRQYEEKLKNRWPKCARLAKKIAENYESEARREDARDEMNEDLR